MVLDVGSVNLIQYLKYVITGRKSIRLQLIGRGSLWIPDIFEMKLAMDNFEWHYNVDIKYRSLLFIVLFKNHLIQEVYEKLNWESTEGYSKSIWNEYEK